MDNNLKEEPSEIEHLMSKLKEDVDNHYIPGKETLTEAQHFELWDRMMELKLRSLDDNK